MRPDVIPQLADAEEVLAAIERRAGVAYSVLIPNERGLRAGARAPRPLRRDQPLPLRVGDPQPQERQPLDRRVARRGWSGRSRGAREEGLRCEGVISVSFGCPYEGEVPPERVFEIAERLAAAGCEEIAFGDTTGMANPRQVGEFFAAARERLARSRADRPLPQHPRPGARQRAGRAGAGRRLVRVGASASSAAARCRPGSTGNISTEDLVSMLHEMGVETGIDLAKLIEASRAAQEAPRPPARRPRAARRAGRLAPGRVTSRPRRRIQVSTRNPGIDADSCRT